MSSTRLVERHYHARCLSRSTIFVPCLLLSLIAGGFASARGDEDIRYNRDIRPILSENCFACHGPDSASRKADLRLDRRDDALAAETFIPGDPDGSELIFRVEIDNKTLIMPPPESRKTLTAEQIDLLRRWVAAGAEYEPHWSFIPPERPEPPEVSNPDWVRNPIDAFILARLDAEGLTPAPEADRRTLARRLSLDLNGLPPDPAEVEAFVNDPAPDAYNRYVDLLLSKPAWGEHRARYWLDAARYADTHGLHFDNYREMWSYRDWVINAFNQNMTFDQFTIEQLAGDLLPAPTLEQKIATGFNRCNITTNEGGTIPEENAVLYTRDRTETVSQVWLGLTANCAVCHDHKFDPFTMRDFYSMSAFFNNSTQSPMDGNIKDTPPIIVVPTAEDRPRWEPLLAEIEGTNTAIAERAAAAKSEFDAWLAAATADPRSLDSLIDAGGQRLQARLDLRDDGAAFPPPLLESAEAGDFEADQPFSVGAWIKLPEGQSSGAVIARMDDTQGHRGWDLWLEGNKAGTHIVGNWEDDALKVTANNAVPTGVWTHVLVSYDGSRKAGGVTITYDGQPQPVTVRKDALTGSIRTAVPLKVGQRHTSAALNGVLIRDLRVFDRAIPAERANRLAFAERAIRLAFRPVDQRPEAEVDRLFGRWLTLLDEPTRALRTTLAALESERDAIKARGTVAHVMQERPEPPIAYILHRGEYDQRRDQVKPDTPDALPAMPEELPRTRLGFAQWLVRPEHPLTARVTVNRYWQEIFGRGLVRTAGDFGVSGELPTHPELLDWLAVEFREKGWDVKEFFKLLVTSSTYRQSSALSPSSLEADPDNKLLSRGPRFRMDAEMVRDYALAASGLLTPDVGGPSVKPYQPEGVWEAVAMPESNTKKYQRDTGKGLYRRSLYTFWKRAAPPASMDVFNAPSREFCTVVRERTNTPLQALVTLNDPQFIEAARVLAQRTLTAFADDEARIDHLAARLLARPFSTEERDIVRLSLDALSTHYAGHPDDAQALLKVGEAPVDPACDPNQLAAWTMLANQIMNLDEVLNK